MNEIETIFEERHEQNESNPEASNSCQPHMTFVYKDKSMIEESCHLIIHHVKRQTSIHKEDKQKIKQLLRQFIPDLFATPRGELSDDEMDDNDIDDNNRPINSSESLINNNNNNNNNINNNSNLKTNENLVQNNKIEKEKEEKKPQNISGFNFFKLI